jgi:hypothetical protein
MAGFATLPVLMAVGTLYAAWQARRPAPGAPWDGIDVRTIGGDGREAPPPAHAPEV